MSHPDFDYLPSSGDSSNLAMNYTLMPDAFERYDEPPPPVDNNIAGDGFGFRSTSADPNAKNDWSHWGNYVPYAVGMARWVIFLLLKVLPALCYRPYTSDTLRGDVQRHRLLMKGNGWRLRLRTGILSGLGGGSFGFGLACLFTWLTDPGTYRSLGASDMMLRSLIVGFVPGVSVFFSFAVFIESVNIRVRRRFMQDIRVHRTDGGFGAEDNVNIGGEKKKVALLRELDNTIQKQSRISSLFAPNHLRHGDPNGLVEPVKFMPADVTVVVPVYEPPPAFRANLTSLIENSPAKILIVADITCASKIQAIVDMLGCGSDLVEVLPEKKPGKRAALSTGLRAVQTRLTCFVDDDCQWCDPQYLPRLILPFDNRTIGGVGSKQIMRPSEEDPKEEGGEPTFRGAKILEIMADFRLSARYIDLMATTAVDRGASCISGRTMCFRTEAIAEEAFHEGFMHEMLCGIHLLSGDDKFLTRCVIKKGYKTYHQLQDGCILTTTFESSLVKHMSQLIRWSRNTWRSDITALFLERKIWQHNPFTAFLLFDKLFTPFYLMYGFFLLPIYSILRMDWVMFLTWIIWLHFSRALKLALHFKRVPGHILYLPIWICYQYLLGFVRIYALFTMLRTRWGNRAVVVVGNQVMRTGEFADQAAEMEEDGDAEERHAKAAEGDVENQEEQRNNKPLSRSQPRLSSPCPLGRTGEKSQRTKVGSKTTTSRNAPLVPILRPMTQSKSPWNRPMAAAAAAPTRSRVCEAAKPTIRHPGRRR